MLCTTVSQPLCPPFPAASGSLFSRHPHPPRSHASSDPDSARGVLQYGWIWRKCYIEGGSLHCLFVRLSITCPPVRAPCIMDRGVYPPVPVISPLEIVVLNQKPEACECGRGLTSPLVLHDLKWAPLHSTTRLGQAAIKRV